MEEVTPRKRGKDVEAAIIRAILRQSFCEHTLFELNASHFAEYRDRRLRKVKPVTVAREFGIVHHCLDTARREWSIPLDNNPLDQLRRLTGFGKRDRRPLDGELERLMSSARFCRNPYIAPPIRFAADTAMRQGELLRARWRDVDLNALTLHVPKTKNGHPRTIPLSKSALKILGDLQSMDRDFIFPTTSSAV